MFYEVIDAVYELLDAQKSRKIHGMATYTVLILPRVLPLCFRLLCRFTRGMGPVVGYRERYIDRTDIIRSSVDLY